MAETKYEIGVLNYHCDTYESAIEFLDTFGKHKSGQPICVFYGSDETEWRLIFAVGSSETDGNKYNILGDIAADDINEKIQWFSLNDEENIQTDGNTLRMVHNVTSGDNVEDLISNNENIVFVGVGDGIGCIWHNGTLYSSPYIEDKTLKEDLVIGETIYPAGSTMTDIIQDILEKINPENVKVDWDNVENKPTNVEDAFACDSFMKKESNLSDIDDSQQATQNLLGGLEGVANNTVLKFEDGKIKWGGVIIGWYDEETHQLIENSEVRFVNISREDYDELSSPDTGTLYFIHTGTGAGMEYELFIGPYPLKTVSYHIEEEQEKPGGVEKRYTLKDSAGIQCGTAIDIPKDKFVTHAELKTVTEPDVPYEGAKVGDEYIDLEILNCEDHIYIPLGDLDVPQSDWNEDNPESGAFIKNKPTKTSDFINDGEGDTPFDPFAKASDLPTKTSDLINDGNGGSPLNPFVTVDEVAQSDWDENDVESPAHILNRTHWKDEPVEEEVIVAEYTGGSEVNIPLNEPLVAGKIYTVVSSGYPDEQYNYTMEIPASYYENGDYFEILLPGSMNFQSVEGIGIIRFNGWQQDGVNITIKYNKTSQEIHSMPQEYIQNPLVDWNQSVPTGAGYVKNRTHYDDGGYDDVIGETLTFDNNGHLIGANSSNNSYYFDPQFEPKEGEVYIFNIEDYYMELSPLTKSVASDNSGRITLSAGGGGFAGGGSFWYSKPGINDSYSNYKQAGCSASGNPNYLAGKHFRLLRKKVDATNPLDKKYIPAGASDWNQNEPTKQGYVENRTHYEEIMDEEYAVFEGTFTVNGSSWSIPEEHMTDYKLWENDNVGYNLFILEIDGIRYGHASTYISNTIAYGGGNALYVHTGNYGDVNFGSFSFGTNGSGFNAYFYFYASGTNINPATGEPIFDPNVTHSYKFYGIKSVKNIKEIEGKYLPVGSTYVKHLYDGNFSIASGTSYDYIYFNLDKEYGLKDAIFTVNFLGTEYKLKFANIYTYTGDYRENSGDWYGSTQYIYYDPNDRNSYFYIYYTSAQSAGNGCNADLYIRKKSNTTFSSHITVDVEYIKKLDNKYLPDLSPFVICKSYISSLVYDGDITDVNQGLNFAPKSGTKLTSFFVNDGAYNANSQNPGLDIPSRRAVQVGNYIYSVGGQNNVNIYRTDTTNHIKSLFVTLDSVHFTSTWCIVYADGKLFVSGNADSIAIITTGGVIQQYKVIDEGSKANWVGLAVKDESHYAVHSGWGAYNTLKLYSGENYYTVTPTKIHGMRFIDNKFYLTHQGGLGIGAYNYGASRIDLDDWESGFINIFNETSDVYANNYSIGRFNNNCPIEELKGAIYIMGGFNRGKIHISYDDGETWVVYDVSRTGRKIYQLTEDGYVISGDVNYGSNYIDRISSLTSSERIYTTSYSSISSRNCWLFIIPKSSGGFSYIYKEPMVQNTSETELYQFDYESYMNIYNQIPSYGDGYYAYIQTISANNGNFGPCIMNIYSKTLSRIILKFYKDSKTATVLVDSDNMGEGYTILFKAKWRDDFSFDWYGPSVYQLTDAGALASDADIDEICQ